jgi:hypothetical protein
VKGGTIVPNPAKCSSTDAALANITFPITGTLNYNISSPTRTLQSINTILTSNIESFTLPAIIAGGHSATGGVFKANPANRGSFLLQVNFVSPAFSCTIDPLTTTLKINTGHEAAQGFQMIPKAEHFIKIDNNDPGLHWLEIDVNGKYDRTLHLQPGRTISVDAALTMNLAENMLTFIGEGQTGSFANIEVSDIAPALSASASPSAARSAQETGIWGHLMLEKAAP